MMGAGEIAKLHGIKGNMGELEKTAEWLGVPGAFPEDPSSDPSVYMGQLPIVYYSSSS